MLMTPHYGDPEKAGVMFLGSRREECLGVKHGDR